MAFSSMRAWPVAIHVVALGLWMGMAVFLSAGVLPLLFTQLPPAEAGRIAALVFPAYFRAGLVLGVLATAACTLLARDGGAPWRRAAAVLALATAAQGWSALVLHPEMARLRGDPSAVERFQDLHRLSVRLNGVVLAGGMLVLAASGRLLARRDD